MTANKDKPFFLFYSITLPHGRHEIDSQGIYKNEKWTEQQKNYAAQVTRLDTDVGRLLAKLKELKLDEKTLVIVAGDNGSSFAPNSEIGKLFDQTMGGKLRGFKRVAVRRRAAAGVHCAVARGRARGQGERRAVGILGLLPDVSRT